jgi:DNA-binding response OmpR family regulator
LASDIDVILLDVMLPRIDGFSVLRRLRDARLHTPVIIVSARDSGPDIVQGLDFGADDYLTKPFQLDILFARIRAVARRVPASQPADLAFGDLRLNPGTYQMQRGGRTASLTRTEFVLLETLIRRAGMVVPREVLIEEVRSLRLKITQPGERELLHTIRGVGYSIRSEEC